MQWEVAQASHAAGPAHCCRLTEVQQCADLVSLQCVLLKAAIADHVTTAECKTSHMLSDVSLQEHML